MSRARGRWARFRRLPAAARIATGLAVVAVYTVAVLAVVGEDDADRPGSSQGRDAGGTLSKAATGDERAVRAIFAAFRPTTSEREDRTELRRLVLRDVRCAADECRIRYTTGVPGAGLILQQQGTVLQRILRETGIGRVSFDVRRQKDLRAPGDPDPAEEETTSGTALFALRCDRARSPEIDPATTSGRTLMRRICTVRAADMAAQHTTSPVRQRRGQGGDGIVEQVPAG